MPDAGSIVGVQSGEDLLRQATPKTPAAAPKGGGMLGGLDQMRAEARQRTQQLEAEKAALPPTPEPPKEAPGAGAPPQPLMRSPLEVFGSMSTFLAILGSLATKQPFMNALMAGGAAMRAIRAGDQQAYEQAYQQWKDSSDYALKRSQYEIDRYRAILDSNKLNVDEKLAYTNAEAASFNDERMLATSELADRIQLMDIRERAASRAQEAQAILELKAGQLQIERERFLSSPAGMAASYVAAKRDLNVAMSSGDKNAIEAAQKKLSDASDAIRAYQAAASEALPMKASDFATPDTYAVIKPDGSKTVVFGRIDKRTGQLVTAPDNKPVEGEVTGKAVDSNLLIPDDAANDMAESYIAGNTAVASNLGWGNIGAENRTKLWAHIEQKLKSSGMTGTDLAVARAEFVGLTQGERTTATRSAQVEMAVNEASNMAQVLRATSDKISRTDFPDLNSVLLAWNYHTGGNDAIQLGASVNSYLNSYVRAVSPVGVPTDTVRQHAYELLDKAYSGGQINAALNQLDKEMVAAESSPDQVRNMFRQEYGARALPSGQMPSALKQNNGMPDLSGFDPKVQSEITTIRNNVANGVYSKDPAQNYEEGLKRLRALGVGIQ